MKTQECKQYSLQVEGELQRCSLQIPILFRSTTSLHIFLAHSLAVHFLTYNAWAWAMQMTGTQSLRDVPSRGRSLSVHLVLFPKLG